MPNMLDSWFRTEYALAPKVAFLAPVVPVTRPACCISPNLPGSVSFPAYQSRRKSSILLYLSPMLTTSRLGSSAEFHETPLVLARKYVLYLAVLVVCARIGRWHRGRSARCELLVEYLLHRLPYLALLYLERCLRRGCRCVLLGLRDRSEQGE